MNNLKNVQNQLTNINKQIENMINTGYHDEESNENCEGIKQNIKQVLSSVYDKISEVNKEVNSCYNANNNSCIEIKHIIDTNKFNGNPNFVTLTMDLQKIYIKLKCRNNE